MKKIAVTMIVAAVYYLFAALTAFATPLPRPKTLLARGVSQNPVTGEVEPGFARHETQGTNIHPRSFDITSLGPRRFPSSSDNHNRGDHGAHGFSALVGDDGEPHSPSASEDDDEPANQNLSESAVLNNWAPCSWEHLFTRHGAHDQAAGSTHSTSTGSIHQNPFRGFNEDQLKEKLTELIGLHSNPGPSLNNNQHPSRNGHGRGQVNIQPDSDTSDDHGWSVEYYLFNVYEVLMPKLWLTPAQYGAGKELRKELVEVARLLSLVTDTTASREYPVRLVQEARSVLTVMRDSRSPRPPPPSPPQTSSPNRSRQASSADGSRRTRPSTPDHLPRSST